MNFLLSLHTAASAHVHTAAVLPFDPLQIAVALVVFGCVVAYGVVICEARASC
jgi:hypothetical protein